MLKQHDSDQPLDIQNVSYAAFLVAMMFLYTDRCIVDADTAPQARGGA